MRYRQQPLGFTLLECMISLALGLMVIALAFSMLVSAMKNSEASLQAEQRQAAVVSVLQWMVNDIANAGAFGCAGTCARNQGLQGIVGNAHQCRLAYQGYPQVALLGVSDNRLHLQAEPRHRFYKNAELLISTPNALERVVVTSASQGLNHQALSLQQPLSLKTNHDALIGPLVQHEFKFNENENALVLTSDLGEPETLLNQVQALRFTYDVKTPEGVVETQSIARLDGALVCGVNISLTVNGETWVRYAPVLSQCL